MSSKQNIYSTNTKSEIKMINGEECMCMSFTGPALQRILRNENRPYADKNIKELVITTPLYMIGYIMRDQRQTVAKWEERRLEEIKRIKEAYNVPVELETK